jgi:hypothetical protein
VCGVAKWLARLHTARYKFAVADSILSWESLRTILLCLLIRTCNDKNVYPKQSVKNLFACRSEKGSRLDFETFAERVGKYFLTVEDESCGSNEKMREMTCSAQLSPEMARSPRLSPDLLRISAFSTCSQQQGYEEASRTVSPPLRIQQKNLSKVRQNEDLS